MTKSRAFSLIELVCVIAIIAVLSAIALPHWSAAVMDQQMNQALKRISSDIGLAQSRANYGSADDHVELQPEHQQLSDRGHARPGPSSANVYGESVGQSVQPDAHFSEFRWKHEPRIRWLRHAAGGRHDRRYPGNHVPHDHRRCHEREGYVLMRARTHKLHPRAFTLIELVAALGITTILLAAIASAVMIATRASTDERCFLRPMTAGRVVDQMSGELESALLVLSQTPTSISFTVPPRNGDTVPEKITYSWAGPSGAPLMRQYNSGTPVSLIDSVDQFSLTPAVITSTESYPGVATEDASDSLIIDNSSTTGSATQGVNASNCLGQYFCSSSWPTGVVGWRPTRVQFQAEQSGLIATTDILMAPALSNCTPAVPYSQQYSDTGLGLLASFGWQQFSFGGIDRLAPAAGVCLMVEGASGSTNSMIVETNSLPGLIQSADGGSTWSYISNKGMVSQLFGKLTRSTTTQFATTKYLNALSITLRAGPSTNPAVTSTAQVLNQPALLSAYWETNFTSNPTTLDANGDGLPDWVAPTEPRSTPPASAAGRGRRTARLFTAIPAITFPN